MRGDEGRALAEAYRALVDDGVPMLTLSLDLGRDATWARWLLECHDLRPARTPERPPPDGPAPERAATPHSQKARSSALLPTGEPETPRRQLAKQRIKNYLK